MFEKDKKCHKNAFMCHYGKSLVYCGNAVLLSILSKCVSCKSPNYVTEL